jgi:glycosyltransferase involved in cell wall biosynthesis
MGLHVCFVVGSLGPSGGVRAIVHHARALERDHGMEVQLAVDSAAEQAPDGIRLITVDEARRRHFDVAIATWWRTAYALVRIPATRRAYFLQQFEERVYDSGDVERLGATLTHDLPVTFLTEAAWIEELMAELRPGAPCHHVPNGIDKDLFAAPPPEPREGPLRVLVEGSPHLWFKGIDDAVAVLAATRSPIESTLVTPEAPPDRIAAAFDRVLGPLGHEAMPDVYAGADVLLKLSRVEGVFTPPLEAFHMGATCVVWPVTGHDEVVRHGHNGVVCDFDDRPGTAGWLDLLARDRPLLARLRQGAHETAAAWPGWPEASGRFAAALGQIVSADDPALDAGQLLADAEAAMTDQRMAQRRLLREAQALERRLHALESSLPFRARKRARRLLASLRR